jgi:hypothetical protein
MWVGYFKAPYTGTYYWRIGSDDASYLWIGNNAKSGQYTTSNAFVNNGGLHGMQYSDGTANISMTAGVYYPIRAVFGERDGGDDFVMQFKGPSTFSTDWWSNFANLVYSDSTFSL